MNKKSLRFRIMFLLSASLVLLSMIALGAILNVELLGEQNLARVESDLTKAKKIAEIEILFGDEIHEWKDTIIRGASPEANAKYFSAFDKVTKDIVTSSDVLRGMLNSDETKLLDDFIAKQEELKGKYIAAREAYLKVDNFLPAKADAEVKGLDRKVLDSLKLLDSKIAENGKLITQLNKSEMRNHFIIILAIVLVVVIFSLVIGHLMISRITNTLSRVTQSLLGSAGEVKDASLNIASTSEGLSEATTKQAASLQETSASVEEISSMVSANTENAKHSSVVSEQSLSSAERGKKVVDDMIKAIGEINTSNNSIMDQINDTNKEIENITKIINEIGTKTKVINDIVFQTKLLSFNASVEAARAGEQGKGFAVVAEEVGNLASMSGSAALEISNMLEGSIKTVEGIVKDSKEKIGKLLLSSREKVETGTRVAHECEEVLNEIVSSVASVSKMATEISTASQEQAQGVHEITKAIAQLDQVTQQNASTSAESANAAGMLSAQADQLNLVVLELAQTISGGTSIASNKTLAKNILSPTHKKIENHINAKEEGEFNFDNAIQAHGAWKQKLSNYIQNPDKSLKHEDVCLDNKCPLGKWIYGEGSKYSHLNEFQKLKPAHAKFHKEAAEIVKKANSGAKVTEEMALSASSPFTNASKEVASIILSLKSKIRNEPVKKMRSVSAGTQESKATGSAVPSHDDQRFVDV